MTEPKIRSLTENDLDAVVEIDRKILGKTRRVLEKKDCIR